MLGFLKKRLHWIVALVIAIGIVVLVASYENAVFAKAFNVKRLLCDGFFVSSVFMLSIGGLLGISQNGGLDAVRYALHMVVERIKHPNPEDWDYSSYYDYVQEKAKKQKTPFAYLLIIGAVFLGLAILLVF